MSASGQVTSSSDTPAANQEQRTPRKNADGIYLVGHGVTPPKLIYSVDPRYTDEARKHKFQEVFLLKIVVDESGQPQNIRVVRPTVAEENKKLRKSEEGLSANAVKAVAQYRFTPAMYQGKAVPVEVNVEVNFRLY